jgi:hypothetical protein
MGDARFGDEPGELSLDALRLDPFLEVFQRIEYFVPGTYQFAYMVFDSGSTELA